MSENKYSNLRNNKKAKKMFKIVGFICLPLGIVCEIIGITSMTSFDFDMFFFSFIGVPLLFVGFLCLSLGFMKEMNSYVASEQVEVAKDVTNYMIDGTRESIVKTANAIKGHEIICKKCNASNESSSKFCDQCGDKLVYICTNCGKENDQDSRFCNNCGKELM